MFRVCKYRDLRALYVLKSKGGINIQDFMVAFLNKRGYNVQRGQVESILGLCDAWYKNEATSFHHALTVNGEAYDLERTNFSKRVCADDANLIECLDISAGDEGTSEIINAILKANNFLKMYRKQAEEVSAMGTVGAYVWLEQTQMMEDGSLRNGNIRIEFVHAMDIVPLTVQNDIIQEVAFLGTEMLDGKVFYKMLMYLVEDGRYTAEVHYFNENGTELPERAQIIQLDSIKPFAILRTAENNNLSMIGYGYPKLWGAIPSLKIVDLVMSLFQRDLEKGDKLVLINEALCQEDPVTHEPMPPNEALRKIFVQVGRDKLPDEKSLYQEYNPEIRVSELRDAMEFALSNLSMMFGYGTRKYTFEQGQIQTASQYIGERQDQMQEVNKQRAESEAYIADLCRAVAYFYSISNSVITVDDVSVDFDDSYVEDKTSKAKQAREDYLAFNIPFFLEKYLSKAYNLSKDEISEIVGEIDTMQDDGEELEE